MSSRAWTRDESRARVSLLLSPCAENAQTRARERNARFWAPPKRARSSLRVKSTSIKPAPWRSWIIMPDVMMGVIPSSMRVPRFEARMTRIQ